MYLSLLFPINSLVSISGSARLKVRYNVALFNTGLTPFTNLPKMFKHLCTWFVRTAVLCSCIIRLLLFLG